MLKLLQKCVHTKKDLFCGQGIDLGQGLRSVFGCIWFILGLTVCETTHCDYKWHCVDHLQYEGYLENLLPNVPLEKKLEDK